MNEMELLETTFDCDSVVGARAVSNAGRSSVVSAYEHRCSAGNVVASNRLSAPECATDSAAVSLRKSRTSSSLVDVNECQFCRFAFRPPGTVVPGGLTLYCCFFSFPFFFSA